MRHETPRLQEAQNLVHLPRIWRWQPRRRCLQPLMQPRKKRRSRSNVPTPGLQAALGGAERARLSRGTRLATQSSRRITAHAPSQEYALARQSAAWQGCIRSPHPEANHLASRRHNSAGLGHVHNIAMAARASQKGKIPHDHPLASQHFATGAALC